MENVQFRIMYFISIRRAAKKGVKGGTYFPKPQAQETPNHEKENNVFIA